jgi:hypothetical protein
VYYYTSGTLNGLHRTIGTVNVTVNGLHGTIGTVNVTVNGLHGMIGTLNRTLNSLHGTVRTENGTLNGLHGTIRTENGWNGLNALALISILVFRKLLLFISFQILRDFFVEQYTLPFFKIMQVGHLRSDFDTIFFFFLPQQCFISFDKCIN